MISICLPSRRRAARFAEMRESARRTARGPIEFIVVLDQDETDVYPPADADTRYVASAGGPQSDLWNQAARHAGGDILQLAADDLIYHTLGWDVAVREAMPPDGIMLIWADDGTQHHLWATHPFVGRRWVDTLRRFTAPYYDAWNADTWLLDLGLKTGRCTYLHKVLIEHRHADYGTAPDDDTYRLRRPLRPLASFNERLEWTAREAERQADADRLLEASGEYIAAVVRDFHPAYREAGLTW